MCCPGNLPGSVPQCILGTLYLGHPLDKHVQLARQPCQLHTSMVQVHGVQKMHIKLALETQQVHGRMILMFTCQLALSSLAKSAVSVLHDLFDTAHKLAVRA